MRNIAEAPGRMSLRLPQEPISTPALLVDLDVFDANVAAMDTLLAGHQQDPPAAHEDASDTSAGAATAGRPDHAA